MAESGGMAFPAEAVGAVWTSLAEVVGTAAAAVLLRRAVKRAAAVHPALHELAIEFGEFRYGLRPPESWHAPPDSATVEAVNGLIAALCEIVEPLSGDILIRRVDRVALLGPYREQSRER